MEDLLRVAFVLVAAATLVICYLGALWTRGYGAGRVHLDQNKYGVTDGEQAPVEGSPKAASEERHLVRNEEKKNKTIFVIFLIILAVILLVICFIYIEYFVYVEKLADDPIVFVEKPIVIKYSGVIVHALLGLFAGLLGYGFYWFLQGNHYKDSPAPKIFIGVWVFLLVVVAVLGLFNVEAKLLMASVKRLETPAGAIEFSAVSDESRVSLSFDNKPPTATMTDFQAGAIRLETALRYAQTDFENIVKFCAPGSAGGPYCAPRLGASEEETDQARYKLFSAMAVTYGYANTIQPIASCLKAYSCFYENGVPIQDDLSEIAASYASPPSEPLGCPESGKKDPICEPVDRIISHLEVFRNQDWDDTAKQNCLYLEPCLNMEDQLPTAEDVISHRNAVLATGTAIDSGITGKTRASGFILPYRSMLSAALLTASGYPHEAVGHMEREYRRLMSKFGRTASSGKETPPPDFVEAVLRLRLLYALQEAGGHAENQAIKLKYQGMERDLARAHLQYNLGVNGYQREELLSECSERSSGHLRKASGEVREKEHVRFVNWLENFPNTNGVNAEGKQSKKNNNKSNKINKMQLILSSVDKVNEKNSTPNTDYNQQWGEYIKKFILYFVNADFLRLYSISQLPKLPIKGTDLLDAGEWWRIATEKPHLVVSCFSHLPDEYIEYLRFQMTYTFGLLHAQKAKRLSKAAELIRSGFTDSGSIPVDMREVRDVACMGYTGLRRAYNIGTGLIEMNALWSEAIADGMHQAPEILRHLAKYLAGDGASCVN